MLASRQRLFLGCCSFQQDGAMPRSAHVTTEWLCGKTVQVQDLPACSPDLSPVENVWRIMKRNIQEQRPGLLVLYEAKISQLFTAVGVLSSQMITESI